MGKHSRQFFAAEAAARARYLTVSRATKRYQLFDSGRRASSVTKRHGITLAVEPLNRATSLISSSR